MTEGLNEDYVKADVVAQKVIEGLYDGVTTLQLDELAAETAATMVLTHPDYSKLAARIDISSLHKITPKTFGKAMKMLHDNLNQDGIHTPMISNETYDIVKKYTTEINEAIVQDKDFEYDYFCVLLQVFKVITQRVSWHSMS